MSEAGLTTQRCSFRQQAVDLFRQAMAGGNYDYTTGSIGRAVVLLAIPMVLEMTLESVFALVDIFFVASLGADAVTVVGLTAALIALLRAFAGGLSLGVAAVIARRIGEKHTRAAVTVAAQTLWLGLVLGIVVGYIGITRSTEILRFMGASPAVVQSGSGFAAVLLGGSFTLVYLLLFCAVFRGAGNASIAMRSLWLANGINIILDPCLIFGLGPFPALGVTGAAVATVIGRGCGMLYLLHHLFDGRAIIGLGPGRLAPSPRVMLSLLRISAGGIGQILMGTTSWLVLTKLVAAYGSEAVAGYTLGTRITIFVILPIFGLSNAASTLVGQNLGAALPQRAELSILKVLKFTFLLLVAVTVLLFPAAPAVIGAFSSDPTVAAYGVYCLRVFTLGLISFSLALVLLQGFNGAGDTLTPTRLNFICFWLVEIPLAWVLANAAGLGPQGVFTAIPLAETALMALAWREFRKGRWKEVKV